MGPKHWLYTMPLRLRSIFKRRRIHRELDEELQYHLDMKIEENIANGMNPKEARRSALISFGSLDGCKEECRDNWPARWIDDLVRDLRYGFRLFAKSPGFTVIAILSLSLGIGATTTVATIIDGTLLRNLDFPNPEQLVLVNERMSFRGELANLHGVTIPSFQKWRETGAPFQDLALYGDRHFKILGADEPDYMNGAVVTANYFEMLGVRPLFGRLFLPEDEAVGSPQVVVLNHGFWQSLFGARKDILGRSLQLGDTHHTIIGVLPDRLDFPSENPSFVPPFFVPLRLTNELSYASFPCIARLMPGVAASRAERVLNAQYRPVSIQTKPMEMSSTQTVVVRSLRDVKAGKRLHLSNREGMLQTMLFLMVGAVILVLLIACANVASGLLARTITRRQEMAIRSATGGTPFRLVRQLLAEILMLGIPAGLLGVPLSFWGVQVFQSFCPPHISGMDHIGLNLGALGYALVLTLVASLAFGIAPINHTLRFSFYDSLKGHGEVFTGGGRRKWLNILLISQISLALLLLIGAGLLMSSFLRLQSLPLGFNTRNLLIGQLILEETENKARWLPFCDQLLEELKGMPGIESVALTRTLPLDIWPGTSGATIFFNKKPPGFNDDAASESLSPQGSYSARSVSVSPGYFRSMGIPLMEGRDFNEQERKDSEPIVIISSVMAQQLWLGDSPIGKSFFMGTDSWRIIGVVGDTKFYNVREQFRPTVYVVHRQFPLPPTRMIIRTKVDPAGLIAGVKARIRSLDKNLPQPNLKTMEQQYSKQLAEPRFYLLVFGFLGIVASALAAAGIYGVVSYSISYRTQELGLRIALGAKTLDVLQLIIHQAMKPVMIGIALGLVAAVGLTRFMSSLLYEINPIDARTFAAVGLVTAVLALCSCYLSARPAIKVDPAEALRLE